MWKSCWKWKVNQFLFFAFFVEKLGMKNQHFHYSSKMICNIKKDFLRVNNGIFIPNAQMLSIQTYIHIYDVVFQNCSLRREVEKCNKTAYWEVNITSILMEIELLKAPNITYPSFLYHEWKVWKVFKIHFGRWWASSKRSVT